ncbi:MULTISPECIES: hypothetical protein [unclassified Pasteurella]|uniref:hypothetical protein n=1 Tax=unclassified Pasteurella TaxID=2621516 RepID=UPI0010742A48|nr:hypothetical protein [Pasteurella sp. 19428wF3_WM03]TFU52373.1 hypothetical protein E4T92_02445 [Pasteurella sp. WM03]
MFRQTPQILLLQSSGTRIGLAGNPNLSEEVRLILAKEGNREVKEALGIHSEQTKFTNSQWFRFL